MHNSAFLRVSSPAETCGPRSVSQDLPFKTCHPGNSGLYPSKMQGLKTGPGRRRRSGRIPGGDMHRAVHLISALSLLMCATGTSVLTQPLSPERERALKPGDSFRECDGCPEMV